jgi:hypothetical protein
MFEGVSEVSGKLSLLRSLAASHGVDALLLQRVSSVAWATAGSEVYVNTSHNESEASLLITGEKQFLFTNNIEASCLEKVETIYPWNKISRYNPSQETGNEILTATPSWPIITVDVDGVLMERPTVQVVEQ